MNRISYWRLSLTALLVAIAAPAQTGGLTSYPTFTPGSNLLVNSSFEVGRGNSLAAWNLNSSALSPSTAAHSGVRSLAMIAANTSRPTAQASQSVAVAPGIYILGAWIKMSNVGAQIPKSGVRICVQGIPHYDFQVCTDVLNGTADWKFYSAPQIVVEQSTSLTYVVEAYSPSGPGPDGMALIDDASLIQLQQPLSIFMLYPNYRGVIFSDQSQIARFDVAFTPPNSGFLLPNYTLTATVTDERTSAIVRSITHPAVTHEILTFDMTGLNAADSYLASFTMTGTSPSVSYSYPSYRMSLADAATRTSMAISFDQANRFLLRGRPAFLLGVYDSGLSYFGDPGGYIAQWNVERRLFELPINLYLNYWWGDVGNAYMLPMFGALARQNIAAFTTTNCYQNVPIEKAANFWFLSAPDADVRTRAANPGFLGFYAADECQSSLVTDVYPQHMRMKALDPGGITFAVQSFDSGLPLWRDAVDVLSRDPYPIYGNNGPYDLSIVSVQTRSVANAVMNARPFMTVLQFFSFSGGPWPTQEQLRNMSYMAIAEGANGLLYWELGQGNGALANVCPGWCPEKIDYFNRLKSVMLELKGLDPALADLDSPDLLVANSAPFSVHTRVKVNAGRAYLIASNTSNQPVSSTFQWSQGLSRIWVYNENRSIDPNGYSFVDSFAPYQAHVYIIGQ